MYSLVLMAALSGGMEVPGCCGGGCASSCCYPAAYYPCFWWGYGCYLWYPASWYPPVVGVASEPDTRLQEARRLEPTATERKLNELLDQLKGINDRSVQLGNQLDSVEKRLRRLENPTRQRKPRERSGTDLGNKALVTVSIPQGAKLYLNGQLTPAQGGKISGFLTPDLVNGQANRYLLEVEWQRGGKMEKEARSLAVQPGARVHVSFDRANLDQMAAR